MPLEVVTTTQQYKAKFAASLSQINAIPDSLNDPIAEYRLKSQAKEVSLEQLRNNLNYHPSRVSSINATLTTTLQDIDDIKLYRIQRKNDFIQNPQPPVQPTLPSSVHPTTGIRLPSSPPERKTADGINSIRGKVPGRKLIGRALLREIQEMAELKDIDALKAYNLQNDLAIQDIVTANKSLSEAAYHCRHMVARGRLKQSRVENLNTLERQRRYYLKKNEDRKEDIEIYPKRLENYCQPHATNDCIDWALQTSEYYKGNVEDELFGMKAEGIFSSSSEEEEEEDNGGEKEKKSDKGKKKEDDSHEKEKEKDKDKKGELTPHSPFPPNRPVTQSPRSLRTPRTVAPSSPSQKKKDGENQTAKNNQQSILQIDMGVQLANKLEDLDKTLYRDFLRQNKLVQMQNRNKTVLNHMKSTKRGRSNSNSSNQQRQKRNQNRSRSDSGVAARSASRETSISAAESDHSRAKEESHHLQTSSNYSTKRTITFEDHSTNPLSRTTSGASTNFSPKSITGKKFSFTHVSIDSSPNKSNTEEHIMQPSLQIASNEELATTKKQRETEQNETEIKDEADDEEDDDDDEEEDEDSFDARKSPTQPVIPSNVRKLLVATYLQHSFLRAIPSDPRGTILHKQTLTTEQQEELMQDRARKMAMVDSIVEELLLEQKEKYDPWYRAMKRITDNDDEEEDNVHSKSKKKNKSKSPPKNRKKGNENKDNHVASVQEEESASTIVNYDAMFQQQDHVKLKPEIGKIYFVSPIGTTLTQDNTNHVDFSEQSIPFREGETKTSIIRSKMKERHVAGYILSSKQLVNEISPRNEGKQITQEVQEYMKQYSILKQTKKIRKSIEKEMRDLKSICVQKSHHITEKASNLVELWQTQNHEKEQLLKDEIQYLRDREFKIPVALRKRQKQFQKFDDKQSSFITFQIPDSQYSQDKLDQITLQMKNQSINGSRLSPDRPLLTPGGAAVEKNKDISNVFVTQMPQRPAAITPSQETKPAHRNARKTTISNVVVSASSRSADSRSGAAIINLGGSILSDNKFTYDYSNQLETIIKQNEEREKKEETSRIISKQWFVSLLNKLKKYKKSSASRLPLSLFLLLSSLKKLIGLNVMINKDIVWNLIDRTIQSEEHRSDLVYSTLKLLFDAVQITVEEIYGRLKQKQIELPPKLLIQIQKERKIKQMKAKIELMNRRSRRKNSTRQMSGRKSSKQFSSPGADAKSTRNSILGQEGAQEGLFEEDYYSLYLKDDNFLLLEEQDEEENAGDDEEEEYGNFENHDLNRLDIDKFFANKVK